jgi:hypothetical protein
MVLANFILWNRSEYSSSPRTVTSAGYYYLRAIIGQCWSTSSASVYASPRFVATPNTPTVSNNCGNSVLSYNGTPPAYTNWYWQTSPNGEDKTYGSSTYTVYSSGTYFLRAWFGYATPYCWSESAPKTVTVIPSLTASISGGTTPICYNTSPGQLSVSPSGGTGSYTYQWYNTTSGIISGATSSTYTPGNLTVSTGYYCAVTSGTCGTVNTSTRSITVYSQLTASINGGTTPICYNTSPGQLSASGSGGTGSYTYQWYNTTSGVISGATGSTYNPGNLTASIGYYCAVTSETCGTVNTATKSIIITTLPAATIFYAGSPFCNSLSTDQPVTLTGTSGGSYSATPDGLTINSGSGAINPSTSTAGSYTVKYSIAASGGCALFETTTSVDINPIPTVISPNVTPSSVCGSGQVAFEATASSGTIKWWDAQTNGTEVTILNPIISETTTYYAEAVSPEGCKSADRTEVTATVNTIPTITFDAETLRVCDNSTVAYLYYSSTTGIPDQYSLYYPPYSNVNDVIYATLPASPLELVIPNNFHYPNTYTLDFSARNSITGCESSVTTITLVMEPHFDVTTYDESLCGVPSGEIELYAKSETSMGATTTISWWADPTGGVPLETGQFFTPTISAPTTFYVDASVNATNHCVTAPRKPVIVNFYPSRTTPTIIGSPHGTICSDMITLSAIALPYAADINWYVTEYGGIKINSNNENPYATKTTSNNLFYVNATYNECTSVRTQVTNIINNNPVITAPDVSRCGPGSVTLEASSSGGEAINWYGNSTIERILETGNSFTTPNISENRTYYVDATTINGCKSPRNAVQAIINPIPTFVITMPEPVCSPATINLLELEKIEGSTPPLILNYTYWKNEGASIQVEMPEAAPPGIYYIKGSVPNSNPECFDIKPVW